MKRFLLLMFLSAQVSYTQTNFSGTIKDAVTGEALPAANIQIEGTLKGVIANRDGKYSIQVDHLPAVFVVRYIGYESAKISLTESTSAELDISLKPAPIEMEALVVLGEDPGIRIMRNVIAKKKSWQGKIQNFQADAYMRMSLENDSGIVMMTEVLADVFWDKKKGLRTVVKSKRHTKNVDPKDSPIFDDEVVNLYDDDVTIQESRFVGPTHPEALDFYDFKITGRRFRDDQLVYDISVETKSKLQPTFVGTISVLDTDSVMIDADLRPNDYMTYPMPIQEWKMHYKQQFSNFGQTYWLPVDLRMDGKIKVGMIGLQFPSIKFTQITGLNNYRVNGVVPDSLFKSRRSVIIDSIALKKPNQFDSAQVLIPMSDREDSAFHSIKRGDSFAKAFKPTGALARMVKIEDEFNDSIAVAEKKKSIFKTFAGGLLPLVWYNRVDGGRLGIKYTYDLSKSYEAYVRGGYTTNLKQWFYGGGGKWFWGSRRRGFVEADYYVGTEERYPSDNYAVLVASGPALFGYRDYFDFYKTKKLSVGTGYEFGRSDVAARIGFSNEIQSSLPKTTDFDLIGRKNDQRPNPAINEGALRAVHFSITYGDEFVPLGFVGQNRAEIRIEHSDKNLLASDFGYTTYRASVDWRFNTFLARRFLPNVFDVRWVGGTYTGHLPIQRMSGLDGSLQYFTPFGAFKTLRGRPYEGEKYTAVFWEHNFRTVPFEIIGLRWLVEKNIGIIIHGGSGRTWISKERLASLGYVPSYTGRFHHEIGASINGLLGFFRIDATERLDKKGFYLGVSVARMF